MNSFKDEIFERFAKYVAVESGSDDKSESFPTTETQREFAKTVMQDMHDIGLEDIDLDKNAYLTATIPATKGVKAPVIGFLAHMDTYPGGTIGRTVVPLLHKNYDGGDIKLTEDIIIGPKTTPVLSSCIGHDIVTASGDTLLGADDKAGIAIIMTFANYLIKNPQIKHGKIRIAFTPDEEVGKGPDKFDVKKFGADFAYTLDGEIGEGIVDENFNAASVTITVKGVLSHPGFAKDIMQNPVRIMADIINAWPENRLPETTCDREGFLCFLESKADFETATANAMVRDFDAENLKKSVDLITKIVEEKQAKYPTAKITLSTKYSYKNMKAMVEKRPEVCELAKKAFAKNGLNPDGKPIRGGTDGARLSFMGLITPNLDAGYCNPHGRHEWASLDAMAKVTAALVTIAEEAVKEK